MGKVDFEADQNHFTKLKTVSVCACAGAAIFVQSGVEKSWKMCVSMRA